MPSYRTSRSPPQRDGGGVELQVPAKPRRQPAPALARDIPDMHETCGRTAPEHIDDAIGLCDWFGCHRAGVCGGRQQARVNGGFGAQAHVEDQSAERDQHRHHHDETYTRPPARPPSPNVSHRSTLAAIHVPSWGPFTPPTLSLRCRIGLPRPAGHPASRLGNERARSRVTVGRARPNAGDPAASTRGPLRVGRPSLRRSGRRISTRGARPYPGTIRAGHRCLAPLRQGPRGSA